MPVNKIVIAKRKIEEILEKFFRERLESSNRFQYDNSYGMEKMQTEVREINKKYATKLLQVED